MNSVKSRIFLLVCIGSSTLYAETNTLDKSKILQIISESKNAKNKVKNGTAKVRIVSTKPEPSSQNNSSGNTKSNTPKNTIPKAKKTILGWGTLGYTPPSSQLLEQKYKKRSKKKSQGMVYTNALSSTERPTNKGGISMGVNKNKSKNVLFY